MLKNLKARLTEEKKTKVIEETKDNFATPGIDDEIWKTSDDTYYLENYKVEDLETVYYNRNFISEEQESYLIRCIRKIL